jgi:hypothetical protein
MADREEVVPAPARWQTWDWILLLTVLIVAGSLRLTHIDPVLSFDEIWHLATTQGYGSPTKAYEWDVIYRNVGHMTSLEHAAPVWAIWQDMREVLHPPGFLISMRLWRDVFGDSDMAAHLFSITWSLVGIVFTFLTGRLAMNRWAGMLCGLSLACAQTQCYLAQEVRAYAMLIALGSIALWIMTRCELQGPTRGRVLWLAVLSLAMLLTHYFALGAAIAIGLYCVLRGGNQRKTFLIAITACALLYIVAWVPFALRQVRDFGVGDVLIKMPQRDLVFTTLMLAGTPFRLIAERDYTMELMPVFSGVLFILPWELSRRFKALVPWVFWLCCTIGAIFVLDIARTSRHAAYIRYLAIATPAVPLLFVGTVWPIRRWLAYTVGGVLSFGGFMYLISRNVVLIDAQPYPEIAKVLSKHIQPGEPILSFENAEQFLWRAPVVLMVAAHEPNVFPRTMALLSKPMSKTMMRDLNAKTAWLLINNYTMAEEIVPGCRVLDRYYGDEDLMVVRIAIDAESPTTEPASSIGAAEPSR